jgi:NADH-quinone oxidoreductase subunit C
MEVQSTNSLIAYLSSTLPGIKRIVVHSHFLVIYVSPLSLSHCAHALRFDQQLSFDQLLDIWGVDYLSQFDRFQVNYLFSSTVTQLRVILRTSIPENEGLISLSSLYQSAGWLEREVWDMFGVLFYEHLDLRRILTDYGFEGHPLRKDYPLSGFTEVRYDDGGKRIVYEPIEMPQEYRSFHFKSPWNK